MTPAARVVAPHRVRWPFLIAGVAWAALLGCGSLVWAIAARPDDPFALLTPPLAVVVAEVLAVFVALWLVLLGLLPRAAWATAIAAVVTGGLAGVGLTMRYLMPDPAGPAVSAAVRICRDEVARGTWDESTCDCVRETLDARRPEIRAAIFRPGHTEKLVGTLVDQAFDACQAR